MKDNVYSIVFGGIGGQGILKASELTGWAAMLDGYSVKKSEVHGMAQRGGSVESHLRFGRQVHSPLIEPRGAGYLMCFHEEEHPRLKPYLAPGGVDLVSLLPQAGEMIENPRRLNTVMVGFLAAHLPIRDPAWTAALETVFPPKILDENRDVFFKARDLKTGK